MRTYVAVDGGMSDNPRPVLYGSGYEAFLPRAVDADRPRRARVVGKHCESGDVLLFNAHVPRDVAVGDLLAVPVTGAYGHSMGSNYNKVPRPPVVFVARRRGPPRRAPRDVRRPAWRPTSGDAAYPGSMPRMAGRPRGLIRRVTATVKNAERDTGRTTRRKAPPTRPVDPGVRIEYTPALDGDPDPGEVVWTWVPYEEDPTLGKDRPVVIIGRHGADLSGVALTTKHRAGGDHVEVGTGAVGRPGPDELRQGRPAAGHRAVARCAARAPCSAAAASTP